MKSPAAPCRRTRLRAGSCRAGLATLALLLQACTAGPTTYRLESGGPELRRATAEKTWSQQVLRAQIEPPLDTPLQVLVMHLPDYPHALIAAEIEGAVRVRFKVEADGRVSEAVALAAPRPELARLCVDAVRQWRFKPPLRAGQPAELALEFGFVFRLAD